MKYLDYKEHREQGTFNFPIAFYHQLPHSPRYYMPYHWHHHYELIRIHSGSFQLTLNGACKNCQEGDVIFISDGVLHGGSPQDHSCVYDCIVFDLQILMKDNHACAKAIQDIMDHRIIIQPLLSRHSPLILPIIENLTSALAGRRTGYEFMTQGCLYQLLGIILQEKLYEDNTENLTQSGRLDSLKKVLSFISENYSHDISLDTLAKVAGMNPKYFCRYFRSMTRRTPIDYLNYYRIECACEMLSTKNVSIRNATISCGFNDESYFIKTFHKYKGITPKQYLKMDF